MNITKQPSKEQVRDWMRQRRLAHKPLPGIEQIRRELGWHIVQGVGNGISDRNRSRYAA